MREIIIFKSTEDDWSIVKKIIDLPGMKQVSEKIRRTILKELYKNDNLFKLQQ